MSTSSDSDQNQRFEYCRLFNLADGKYEHVKSKVIKCNTESFSETRSECLITKRCKMDVMISQEKDVNLKTFSIIQLERK